MTSAPGPARARLTVSDRMTVRVDAAVKVMPVITKKGSRIRRLARTHAHDDAHEHDARPMDTTHLPSPNQVFTVGQLDVWWSIKMPRALRVSELSFQLVKQSKLYRTSCANRATFETAE